MIILPPSFVPMRTPTVAFGATAVSATNGSSFSGGVFNGLNIGAPSPDRIIFWYVALRCSVAGTQTLTGLLASGSLETNYVNGAVAANSGLWSGLLYSKIPTGTTTDVSFSTSGTCNNLGVAWWIARGISNPASPYDAAFSLTDNGSLALDIPNNGIGIAGAVGAAAAAAHTWTGFSESFDTAIESGENSFFSGAIFNNPGGIILNQACSADCAPNPGAGFSSSVSASFR